jgi:hypothetical protein
LGESGILGVQFIIKITHWINIKAKYLWIKNDNASHSTIMFDLILAAEVQKRDVCMNTCVMCVHMCVCICMCVVCVECVCACVCVVCVHMCACGVCGACVVRVWCTCVRVCVWCVCTRVHVRVCVRVGVGASVYVCAHVHE